MNYGAINLINCIVTENNSYFPVGMLVRVLNSLLASHPNLIQPFINYCFHTLLNADKSALFSMFLALVSFSYTFIFTDKHLFNIGGTRACKGQTISVIDHCCSERIFFKLK